jgi:hypothetical protein
MDKLKILKPNIGEEDYNISKQLVESKPNLFELAKEHSSSLAKYNIDLHEFFRGLIFVQERVRGHTVLDSYILAFKDEVEHLSDRAIKKRATSFNMRQFVVELQKNMMLPLYIMYSNYRNEAIEVLAGMMKSDKSSDRIKLDSARAVLEHTVVPEEVRMKIESTLTVKDQLGTSIIDELKQTMNSLSNNLKDNFKNDNKALLEAEIIKRKIDNE